MRQEREEMRRDMGEGAVVTSEPLQCFRRSAEKASRKARVFLVKRSIPGGLLVGLTS